MYYVLCTIDYRLLQNMALKAFAGDQLNYFFARDRCALHSQYLVAILQVKVYSVMREMGKKPRGKLPGQVLFLNVGFKNFHYFHPCHAALYCSTFFHKK